MQVHMSAPNVEQFIDLLISIPAEGYDNSFTYVMSEWTKQQGRYSPCTCLLLERYANVFKWQYELSHIYLSFNDEWVIQIEFHSGFVVLANILNQEKLVRGFIVHG
jgi:hypothetical protein